MFVCLTFVVVVVFRCSKDDISSTAESQNELTIAKSKSSDKFGEQFDEAGLAGLITDKKDWNVGILYKMLKRDGWVVFLKNLQVYRMELISGIWRLELLSYKGYVFDEAVVTSLDGWGRRMKKAAEFMGDKVIANDLTAYLHNREALGVPDSNVAYSTIPFIKIRVKKRNRQIAELEHYIEEKCLKSKLN